MADSGVDERGEWTPAFPGQRRPFEPGHELSTRHGAYALVQLGARVDELAAEIRELVPGYRPADEIAVRVLSLALARLERSSEALGETTDATEMQRLRQDERGWANTVRRYLNDLGLSPVARAGLGLDVARARQALTVTALAEDAELERHGRREGEASS